MSEQPPAAITPNAASVDGVQRAQAARASRQPTTSYAVATSGPVSLMLGNTAISVPRFKRKDWSDWAAEIDRGRLAASTQGMSLEERFLTLGLYNILPTTYIELRKLVETPSGSDKVIRTCFLRVPGWDDRKVDDLLESNDDYDIVHLAIMLSAFPRARYQEVAPTSELLSDAPGAPDKLPSGGDPLASEVTASNDSRTNTHSMRQGSDTSTQDGTPTPLPLSNTIGI